jgi:hypothetical protein
MRAVQERKRERARSMERELIMEYTGLYQRKRLKNDFRTGSVHAEETID